MVLFFVTERYG